MGTRNIYKHLDGVLYLPVLLVPGQVLPLPGRMAQGLSDVVALAVDYHLLRIKQGRLL